MDNSLFDHIYQQQPQFNHDIAIGLASIHLKEAESYIDSVWKCAARGFQDGLAYEGYVPCTPHETYAISPARYGNGNRRTKDLAASNIYMCKYLLSFKGEMLRPVYLMLPYPEEKGGLVKLSGSTFMPSPVLADKVVSVCADHVFVPLNRARLTFKQMTHHYICNGEATLSPVIFTSLYQNPSNRRSADTALVSVNMHATPGHYLFCKYGLETSFALMGAPDIRVGDGDLVLQLENPSEWNIYSSRGLPPHGVGHAGRKSYRPTEIQLAVPKAVASGGVEGLVAAFFYVVDHFADRIFLDEIDDASMWKVMMGHAIFKSNQSAAKLISEIDQHLANLDEYVDYMSIDQFAEVGLNIQNLYDLFIYLLHEMPRKMAELSGNLASLYGKRLMINRYALSDVVKEIFLFYFRLRSGNKVLTKNDIETAIARKISPSVCMKMNYGHPEISSIHNAGDNLVFDISSRIVQQSSNSRNINRKAKQAKSDHTTFLNASFAEVGSINHTNRSDPIGTKHINPYVKTDELDTVLRDPSKRTLLDQIQRDIER